MRIFNKKDFIFCLAVAPSFSGICQEKAILTGRVLDEEHQTPLSSANITVNGIKDKTCIATALSGPDGSFTIRELPMGDSLQLLISYTGYDEYKGSLILSKTRFAMQPVLLHPGSKTLEQVVVKAVRPMMVIRGDTVEFAAGAFKTPPNAMAEDLIRRIPGLTIDENAKFFFNGRPVGTIVVDGRPVFSSDGGVALHNIPVDLIDKIQLAGTKTRQEQTSVRKA